MSSPSPHTVPRLLDTDLALSQIGDADAMHEMLVLLQESLTRDVPGVAALLQQGDGIGANRLLHALKGFIPIFCQAALCDEVMRVEAISKEPISPQLATAYAALQPQLEHLLAEVSAHLQNHGTAG